MSRCMIVPCNGQAVVLHAEQTEQRAIAQTSDDALYIGQLQQQIAQLQNIVQQQSSACAVQTMQNEALAQASLDTSHFERYREDLRQEWHEKRVHAQQQMVKFRYETSQAENRLAIEAVQFRQVMACENAQRAELLTSKESVDELQTALSQVQQQSHQELVGEREKRIQMENKRAQLMDELQQAINRPVAVPTAAGVSPGVNELLAQSAAMLKRAMDMGRSE